MRAILHPIILQVMVSVLFLPAAEAATKVHVISFGKWTSVSWLAEEHAGVNDKPISLKIRPLIIDGRIREYLVGLPHDVTDRLFIARRVFRMNDSLTEDSAPRWQWQRGGWLLVDRMTGRVSPVNLPDFDVFYSPAAWYRDYVAYCGLSDDGKATYAMVAQIGRRKPVLKKPMASAAVTEKAGPDSACAMPSWQQAPVRVSFETTNGDKETFSIRGHVVDLVNDADDQEEESKESRQDF
jgi:hypothetical protein